MRRDILDRMVGEELFFAFEAGQRFLRESGADNAHCLCITELLIQQQPLPVHFDQMPLIATRLAICSAGHAGFDMGVSISTCSSVSESVGSKKDVPP